MIRTGRLGAAFLVHDADWQTPAITEAHAFRQSLERLPAVPGFVYLAFPWATLIDQIQQGRDPARLQAVLDRVALSARGFDRVVTVCQHVFMAEFAALFAAAGVTDIFWAHARNSGTMPGFENISVVPFPLYPVNSPGFVAERGTTRQHLFSFVGSKPDSWYMDSARTMIVEELAGVEGGYIREREVWHFHQAVYDHQIYQRVAEVADPLANDAAAEYRAVMTESLFVLCPSGTGPNSLRLWEAIDCGAIPVIISPLYAPPGDAALWRKAALSIDASRAAIGALPSQLRALARDESRINAMRSAIAVLRGRYGAQVFVHDIVQLYHANQRGWPGLRHRVSRFVAGCRRA